MPLFSFLLPTRGRPELVMRFFESIIETTTFLGKLEIILAIDDDDTATQAISHTRLHLKKIILPRGKTMGSLNNACFRASTGRYVMVVNDDIILRTKGWDEIVASVFQSYGDDIGLVHVNDLLFREKLCTFPLISRRACLEIGLCPEEYQKYKIDDHIYDTYNMLAYIGHKRITYLDNVIFEHDNYTHTNDNKNTHAFHSSDSKIYLPNIEYIEHDDAIFHNKLDDRKEAAIRLAKAIDGDKYNRIMQFRTQARSSLLNEVRDPFSYRKSDFVSTRSNIQVKSEETPRTTIAIVSANIRSEYASRCISLVKNYTTNYDLLIMDNNRYNEFSHPKEMNKVLRNIETPFVVLMDDDVLVEPGWLTGLFKCVNERTAVVAPMHKNGSGKISFTGAYLSGDGRGTHEHTFDIPDSPRVMQCYCSAVLLLDMSKCGHILMNEAYKKYFFDIAHGLEIWEAGYEAVCTPEVIVTHLGGATAIRGTDLSNKLFLLDGDTFSRMWVHTGRLAKLEQGVWQAYPYLRSLCEVPQKIDRIRTGLQKMSIDDFVPMLAQLLTIAFQITPHDDNLFVQRLKTVLNDYIFSACAKGKFGDAKSCIGLICNYLRQHRSGLERFKILRDLDLIQVQYGQAIDRFAAVQSLKQMAIDRYAQGDITGAEHTFRKALDQAPKDGDILLSLGKICFESERYEEAMKYHRDNLRLRPGEIESWIGIALIGRKLDNNQILRMACNQIKAISPHHPKLRELMTDPARN